MQKSTMLKKALLVNAAFSALSGAEMLFFPDAISRFIGFSAPGQLRELGVALLLFAAAVAYTATRRPIRIWAAGLISALDVAWVVGTAALLVARPDLFNTVGVVSAVVVALAVADFAFFQVLGIRRLTAAAQGRHDGGAAASLAHAAPR